MVDCITACSAALLALTYDCLHIALATLCSCQASRSIYCEKFVSTNHLLILSVFFKGFMCTKQCVLCFLKHSNLEVVKGKIECFLINRRIALKTLIHVARRLRLGIPIFCFNL